MSHCFGLVFPSYLEWFNGLNLCGSRTEASHLEKQGKLSCVLTSLCSDSALSSCQQLFSLEINHGDERWDALLLSSLGRSTWLLRALSLLSWFWLPFGPSLSKVDLPWLCVSCSYDAVLMESLEWVLPPCALRVVVRRISQSYSCSSLGCEIASSSSNASHILS
jgi:hypothetical protein